MESIGFFPDLYLLNDYIQKFEKYIIDIVIYEHIMFLQSPCLMRLEYTSLSSLYFTVCNLGSITIATLWWKRPVH